MANLRTDGHRPMQHDAKSIAEFIEACRAYMRMRRLSLQREKFYLTRSYTVEREVNRAREFWRAITPLIEWKSLVNTTARLAYARGSQ